MPKRLAPRESAAASAQARADAAQGTFTTIQVSGISLQRSDAGSTGARPQAHVSTVTVTSEATSFICRANTPPSDFSPPIARTRMAVAARVQRNPLRPFRRRRSTPNSRACVPAGVSGRIGLCVPLQESNRSCLLRNYSRSAQRGRNLFVPAMPNKTNPTSATTCATKRPVLQLRARAQSLGEDEDPAWRSSRSPSPNAPLRQRRAGS
jgi:hypothetical protein